MSIAFHFSNALKIFKRRKGSSFRILLASCVATVAAAFGSAGYFASLESWELLSDNLIVSVFFKPFTPPVQMEQRLETLRKFPGIASVQLVTPEEARQEFEDRMGESTEFLFEDNPFPAVAKIRFRKDFRNNNYVEYVTNYAKRMREVSDATYRADFAEAVYARSQETFLIAVAVGGIAFALFLFTLNSALRSEMAMAFEETHVLHVLGASRWFIAAPHLIFALITSLLGIMLGSGIALVLYLIFKNNSTWLRLLDWQPLIAGGAIMGSIALLVGLWTAWNGARRRVFRRRFS
ncbi:MAG TPA: permease-like cell division protein FtsX [Patescibacteria group bacterium]|nr:permease-like cell division protein FtsX [Patescibacteria group bacterium]